MQRRQRSSLRHPVRRRLTKQRSPRPYHPPPLRWLHVKLLRQLSLARHPRMMYRLPTERRPLGHRPCRPTTCRPRMTCHLKMTSTLARYRASWKSRRSRWSGCPPARRRPLACPAPSRGRRNPPIPSRRVFPREQSGSRNRNSPRHHNHPANQRAPRCHPIPSRRSSTPGSTPPRNHPVPSRRREKQATSRHARLRRQPSRRAKKSTSRAIGEGLW